MKCAQCNERNGNTRCEGCNTLFCLPCMNKHHEKLAQQFQLLMDVRNEVKQSLDASRSNTSNGKKISCLVEIDRWEQDMIQRIQKIAANVRINANELMIEQTNEISDRFERISTQMQQQQKEGDYSENDIERIRDQLDQLKNDIKRLNKRIRVDSSQSSNIEWDTLLYMVVEESRNQTSKRMPTKDQARKESRKPIVRGFGRGKKKDDTYDSSQNSIPEIRPVAEISPPSSMSNYIQQSNSSPIHPFIEVNPSGLCALCDQPFDNGKLTHICPTCNHKFPNPSVYDYDSSRLSTRLRSTNTNTPISDHFYSNLSPTFETRPLNKITCPHCKLPNFPDNLNSEIELRCLFCETIIPVSQN